MTRDEFESLLEEAFLAGYEDAMNEVFEESDNIEIEDYDVYDESSKNVRRQMDKLNSSSDKDSYAIYKNGKADKEGNYDPKAINKGLNWTRYTKDYNADKDKNGEYKASQGGGIGSDSYEVDRRTGTEKSSRPRGRIKVRNEYKNGTSRIERIKELVEKNKRAVANRKVREIAEKNLERSKPKVFAGKGNRY